MKFCKSLRQVIDFSNPEWAPFWMNYKLLKKSIKYIPLVVSNDALEISSVNSISKNPNEVKFFKHLHAELEKASSFFTKAKKEMKIRCDRVYNGSKIFNNSECTMTVQDRWMLLGRSLFKLHNNLLLLETFAITNYCGFSKILKKHDKNTGYKTKMAFMQNVVNKSSFAAYPDVLDMIRQCEALHDQASKNIVCEEKQHLREDEQLFISMVHKLHTPALTTKDDVAFDKRSRTQVRTADILPIKTQVKDTETKAGNQTLSEDLVEATGRLRSVSEGLTGSEAPLLDDAKGSKDDEPSTLDPEWRCYRQRSLLLTDHQRSNKQRCHY